MVRLVEASPLLEEIDRLKAEIDALRPLAREQEQRIMQKFRLDWNYHSNAIEGNTLTQGETRIFLLYGLTAKGKPLRDHLDLKGHDEAIDYMVDVVRQNDPLTEAALRELHKLLLGKEPYRVPAQTAESRHSSVHLLSVEISAGESGLGRSQRFQIPRDAPVKQEDVEHYAA
ncbi:MAG: Fic family protein, partial [Rhodothermales bacterium]